MSTRGRVLGAAATVFVAWSGAQLWLTHRLAWAAYHKDAADLYRLVRLHPTDHVVMPQPVQPRFWLVPGLASVLTALALVAVAALLVRGGRRWWALVVTAAPAANFWYGWEDGRALGNGWVQLTRDHLVRWEVTGTIVDTAMLALVVAALVATVPRRTTAGPIGPVLLRALAPMVVLFGWWQMRNPLPDQVHEIWLIQALAWVLLVALLADAELPLSVRAGAVFVVLPFGSLGTTWSALLGDNGIRWLHHDLFAAAVVAYAVGVPALVERLRHRPAVETVPA